MRLGTRMLDARRMYVCACQRTATFGDKPSTMEYLDDYSMAAISMPYGGVGHHLLRRMLLCSKGTRTAKQQLVHLNGLMVESASVIRDVACACRPG